MWARACSLDMKREAVPFLVCRAEGRTSLTAEVMDGVGECMGREQ